MAAPSDLVQPFRIGGELEQPMDGWKAALQDVPVVATEKRRRQHGAVGPLTDADAPLLPENDAQRVGGVTEDPLVSREQTPRRREALEGRRSHHVARGHAEHATEVDQRPERAVFEAEDSRLLTALLD